MSKHKHLTGTAKRLERLVNWMAIGLGGGAIVGALVSERRVVGALVGAVVGVTGAGLVARASQRPQKVQKR